MNKQVSVLNEAGRRGADVSAQARAHIYPQGGRPTMKDVASRARVGLKTVSRVVNGEPGVTAETTSRVLGAIEDLGFRRNESARLLRTGRTATLGFIAGSWADPDHAAVCRGLEDVARSHGYLLYSGSTDGDQAREEWLALAMCSRRVDGLVISSTSGSHDYLAAEIEAGVAPVFVLRPSAGMAADTVLPDERGGGRAAVAHLIAQGHRRIGFLGRAPGGASEPAGDVAGHRSRQLLAGYAEAMDAAGLTADPAWTALDAGSLGRAPVTAVLCADRTRTEAALYALSGLGRTDDHRSRIAIIGFGDFELADLFSPALTVVSYDPALIGRTAGELLIRRLAGDHVPPRTVEVPVTLIPRGSAEFPPPDR